MTDFEYLISRFNIIEDKLDDILKILRNKDTLVRHSSYSQSLDARGKEWIPITPGTSGQWEMDRNTGKFSCKKTSKHERKDQGTPENPFSDRP